MAPKDDAAADLPPIDTKNPTKAVSQLKERFNAAIESAAEGGRQQAQAEEARKRAREATSPGERRRAEKEAEELEKQAKRQFQITQRLQSGLWQGMGAGGAMGAGAGLGLGAVTGTLVGGVLAVPFTGLGGLVGAGVGALHGPWVKLTRGDKGPEISTAKEGEPGAVQLNPGEALSPSKELERQIGQMVEKTNASDAKDSAMKTASGLYGAKQASKKPRSPIKNSPEPGRKAPKKLEVRSNGT